MDTFSPKSIAIVGAGAIGTYYGVRLARAGHDVRLLLRSDLTQVRAHGIRVVEKDSQFTHAPVAAFASSSEIGPVDLVLVTLKTTANAELARLLPPLLRADTAVVTLQNGLGNEEQLAAIVGSERTLGGLCFIAATRTAPGEVTCYHPGSITLGEFGRVATERSRAIAALFSAAGIKCQAVDQLSEARWKKLVWNIPFNGLSIAAGGVATDRLCADPLLTEEIHALMREVQVTAGVLGYSIPDAFLQQQFAVTPPMGAYRPSSLVDYLAGREIEVEPIWGEPLRRAQAVGVATPRLSLLYALIKALPRRAYAL